MAGLHERLPENEVYRRSLEEKHVHAPVSLEHFRQSVKEQRDQDQRRHGQKKLQLQAELRQRKQTVVIKLEETTRLNQEVANLVAKRACHKSYQERSIAEAICRSGK